MNLRIELTHNPTEEQRQAILQPLIEYNDAQTGGSKSEPFALMVKDQNGEILGGLYGRMIFRWMFIELLSVPEQGRGQGLGSKLMAQAEALAREKIATASGSTPSIFRRRSSTGSSVSASLGKSLTTHRGTSGTTFRSA